MTPTIVLPAQSAAKGPPRPENHASFETHKETAPMAKRRKTTQTPITRCARQGDVLVLRRDAGIPTGATEKPRDAGRVVLAYGEVTGHAHAFRDPGVCSLRAEGVAFDLLRVTEGVALLQHEEHATIPVGPGTYEVRIQRTYDWSTEASRAVED